jgi:Cu/Ag efflux protein CusF
VQQDNPQTTGSEQETINNPAQKEENGHVQMGNTAPQLVPQQGEIKNNDHDLEAGKTSLDHR